MHSTFSLFLYIHTSLILFFFFFFNDPATTEIYTLSLHDALPICSPGRAPGFPCPLCGRSPLSSFVPTRLSRDRKSTRLNSSHQIISYAVFCLKKKKKKQKNIIYNHIHKTNMHHETKTTRKYYIKI